MQLLIQAGEYYLANVLRRGATGKGPKTLVSEQATMAETKETMQ